MLKYPIFLQDKMCIRDSAQAIREGKMDIHTKDFTILTGDTPISVRYMFDHQEEFQIGERPVSYTHLYICKTRKDTF